MGASESAQEQKPTHSRTNNIEYEEHTQWDRHIINYHSSINSIEHDEDPDGDDIISTTTTTMHMSTTWTSRILHAVLSRVNKHRHACAND